MFSIAFLRAIAFFLLLDAVANAHDVILLGLPELPAEARTPSAGQAALGRLLFSDPRLSADGTISCASCHRPERDFADGRTVAIGIGGRVGTRNAPSLYNVVYATSLFWDGRSPDLEAQAIRPLLNGREHGLGSQKAVLAILDNDSQYRGAFNRVFGQAHVSIESVATVLAAYERTLLSGDSQFDRYFYGKDQRAMSGSAIRGLSLFRGRSGCATCHTIGDTSALFTDHEFHASSRGLPKSVTVNLAELIRRVIDRQAETNPDTQNDEILGDPEVASLGRFIVTGIPKDIGLFKTPPLRNVAITGPYLHDGSAETLNEVVELELYNRGDIRSPIVATAQERNDLVEFLKALTSQPSK